jgi:hypothetical protein
VTKSAARELALSLIRVTRWSLLPPTPMTDTIHTDERFASRYLAKIPLDGWAEPDEVVQRSCFWPFQLPATSLVRFFAPTVGCT